MSSYLTAEIPGTGGVIKETPDDFVVTEMPLYVPCGDGEHLYVEIEKRGVTTLDAVKRICRALNVPDREVGYAGMKDARGVTRQTLSIPRVAPELVLGLQLPGITVLSAVRHRNKLRLGHLAGNLFRIRVRGVVEGALEQAVAAMTVMAQRGVPNFFGEQRYGSQGNSHLIGRAMLRSDWRGAVETLVGEPSSVRDERWRAAIDAFRRGELEECLRLFPGHCRTERDVVQRLAKRPEEYEKAFNSIHPRLKKLYLSAFQSWLFDLLLAKRLDSLDRVVTGDVAFKHDNGACFLVEDAVVESSRAEAFEISPTGPMFGAKMKLPAGFPLELEQEVLRDAGLGSGGCDLGGGIALDGERRPLRVPLKDWSASLDEGSLVLEFALPKGSYATSVLREIMKPA